MEKNLTGKKRNNKGITLIALIITSIILLILAGLSIASLTGENGILTKATVSKEENDRESIKEQIKIQIMGKQSENEGKIEEALLKEILGKYGDLQGSGELKEQTLVTTEGSYKIKVSEIYNEKMEEKEEIIENASLLVTQIEVGDFVNYEAGEWEETVEATKNNGAFGGYTKGNSKNKSIAAGDYTGGWQVLSVEDDTIELVHAGCPARYFRNVSYSQTESIRHLNEFCKNYFLNSKFARDARCVEYHKDYSALSNSAMLNNLRYFWFATQGSPNLWAWCEVRATDTAGSDYSPWSVRPVVVLKSGIKTTGKADNGYGQSGWVLIP